MSDSYGFDETSSGLMPRDLPDVIEKTKRSTNGLTISANTFANAMTKAFTQATVGGKQFDDVLKSMALKLSSLAVAQAFKPIASGIAKGLTGLLGELFPGAFPTGRGGGGGGENNDGQGNCCCCKSQPTMGGGCLGFPPIISNLSGFKSIFPFASGGVIGTPSYFPLSSGGLGLAGEAGPEAIVPLARGPDGRLGVATAGAGAGTHVTVQIATPDAASFRRSEAYITGQIARAVARGQRSL